MYEVLGSTPVMKEKEYGITTITHERRESTRWWELYQVRLRAGSRSPWGILNRMSFDSGNYMIRSLKGTEDSKSGGHNWILSIWGTLQDEYPQFRSRRYYYHIRPASLSSCHWPLVSTGTCPSSSEGQRHLLYFCLSNSYKFTYLEEIPFISRILASKDSEK